MTDPAQDAETRAMRMAINRVAIAATNTLMEAAGRGVPRHIFLPFSAIDEIEASIVAVLERENGLA